MPLEKSLFIDCEDEYSITDRQFYKYNKENIIYTPVYFYIVSNNYIKDIQNCFYNALKLARRQIQLKKKNKLIAVIDLDETFLFNDYYLNHTLEVYRYNYYIYEFYKKKLDKKYGPVIPFMIILYEYLIKNNVEVFFLTARDTKFKEDTVENLKLFNINKYKITFKKGNISSIDYKMKEIEKIRQTGDIILCMNDQVEFYDKNMITMPRLYVSS